jgi:ribosome biogenesis GTPase
VLIANPDQAIFVFAAANPSPRLRMLDRFLVVAESNHVPAVLCINKCDLVDAADLNAQFEVYRNIGYHVLFTSVHTGQGLLELQNLLQGKISILSGPSGVGKSSLLNALQPGLGVAVKSVSSATEKGRHTTVHPELFPLPSGGWLADTPGIRSLALYDLEPVELDAYFVEIAPHVSQCEFSDCSHQHEPGCAVKRALAAGKISLERYNSYLSIYLGEEEI